MNALQEAKRRLEIAQSGNPEADLFYQDVALYAQIAQAEAAERQAAALERIAQLMETQEADRQADLRREEMRAEWAARAANPGY